MQAEVYWIPMPSTGRLAILSRPRGGDWLTDEVAAWRRAGVNVVVSLLTPDEVETFELGEEAAACREHGIEYLSIPIPDRGVPTGRLADEIARLAGLVADGKAVAVHCRQGIGRSAMLAARILMELGLDAGEAVRRVGEARGCPVPETPEQRRWIEESATAPAAR